MAALRQLKAWSGRSFRDLARLARDRGRNLPASTLGSALTRPTLPSMDIVVAIAEACELPPEEVAEWVRLRRQLAQLEVEAETAAARATPAKADLVTPYLLPSGPTSFVGRRAELSRAGHILTAEGRSARTVLITGPAGVGKTTLAVRLAQLAVEHFADGQLFADLRGPHPQSGVSWHVLGVFLRTLGVSSHSVPAALEDRINLYRSLLAQRSVLIVLDNAAAGRDVQELIVSGPRTATVVTSRSVLPGLDGFRVPLRLLSEAEALEMVKCMIGEDRVSREQPSAFQIVNRCARLPLAVWIAGARLAARPDMPLSALARALADEHRKLDELTVGDVAVRASIELTYAALSRQQQEAMCHLAQINTVDFAPWALAALMDSSPADATKLLDDLVELHLLLVHYTDNAAPRYQMHDLVATFARDKAAQILRPVQTERARLRMLGGALGLACAAGIRINTDFDEVPFAAPPWSFSAHTRDAVLDDPLAWFKDEYGFLKTLAEDMLSSVPLPAAGLIVALAPFMQLSGYFDDWLHLHTCAMGAVASGPIGAGLRRNLGELSTIVDDYPAAERHYRAAIAMLDPADEARLASTSAGLAYLCRLQSRYAEAEELFGRAIDLADAAGNDNCLIYATTGLGVTLMEQGRRDEATTVFEESLRRSEAIGYLPGQAQAWRCLGQISRLRGDYVAAERNYRNAERISLSLGDQLTATHARCWLGDVLVKQGRAVEGRRVLAESLWIYRAAANRWGEAAALHCLAEAQLSAGRPDLAKRRAQVAVAIWTEVHSPYWLASAKTTLSRAQERLKPV
ncbi:response regulator [Micromonospora ureilytica]|uniref:Response regulator n=1 Tax=Micromonospora ureilytica TaxID=709868 RepID=A0A3N9XSX7_9ACTN|nr:response regulator [Micromonospora ureilytica]